MPDAIDLDSIVLKRGGRTLLDRLTWRVPVGSCCAVLGPNGAGKSTLLAIITGYLWPQKGTVRVLGEQYGRVDLTRFRRQMGILGYSRLPEHHADMTALETVVAGLWGGIVIPPNVEPNEEDLAAARRELLTVGMSERANEYFGSLSSGEQMRTLLARALVANPDLLILDEPTAALDMAARASFKQALDRLIGSKPGMTVALVTHYVEDLPLRTQEVLLLREGRMIASGPIGQALSSENLSETFGCEVNLYREDGHYWTQVRLTNEKDCKE
jgi:iron complex transport system ATP-binding protein